MGADGEPEMRPEAVIAPLEIGIHCVGLSNGRVPELTMREPRPMGSSALTLAGLLDDFPILVSTFPRGRRESGVDMDMMRADMRVDREGLETVAAEESDVELASTLVTSEELRERLLDLLVYVFPGRLALGRSRPDGGESVLRLRSDFPVHPTPGWTDVRRASSDDETRLGVDVTTPDTMRSEEHGFRASTLVRRCTGSVDAPPPATFSSPLLLPQRALSVALFPLLFWLPFPIAVMLIWLCILGASTVPDRARPRPRVACAAAPCVAISVCICTSAFFFLLVGEIDSF